MNTLSLPIIMMTDILLFITFYELFVYFRRKFKHREDLTFALTCLTMAVFNYLSFREYNSTSVAETLVWQRSQVAMLPMIGIALIWFAGDYLEVKMKKFRNFFSVYFLFSAVFIMADRSPLTLKMNQPDIKTIVFSFLDRKVTFYEVAAGSFTNLTGVMGIVCFICILIISIRQYRRNSERKAKYLSIAISFLLIGLCNDLAVHVGLYRFIYLMEYSFMAIVLLITYSISDAIVESAIVKEKLIQEQYLTMALLNTVTDNIYFKDSDSRFVRINKSMADWFGIDTPENAIGKTDFDFFSEKHAKQAYDDEQKIIQTGKQLKGIEEKETWRDGHETWVSTTKAPLHDLNGNIVGTFGISRDITDRKRIEEALKKARIELDKKAKELSISNKALKKSNEELEQFAYVASHDLQEPLRMLSSYITLIAKRYQDRLDQDGREFIEFALDGAQRMQVLIRDLLEYSRAATQAKLLEPTDTGQVLKSVLSNLSLTIKETRADISCADLPKVMADAVQLERLFQNLLGNAIKYNNQTPEIHISAERKAAEWIFTIRDNGIGIGHRYQDHIFDIFKRLHGRDEYSGTGIGLAVCKKIVERHGGRIWVESEGSGKGSTFFFTLRTATA